MKCHASAYFVGKRLWQRASSLRSLQVVAFVSMQAQAVKDIEKTTNHDVKAIEYMLKEEFKQNAELHKVSTFSLWPHATPSCLLNC
jgi:adenylosuccinate lyase